MPDGGAARHGTDETIDVLARDNGRSGRGERIHDRVITVMPTPARHERGWGEDVDAAQRRRQVDHGDNLQPIHGVRASERTLCPSAARRCTRTSFPTSGGPPGPISVLGKRAGTRRQRATPHDLIQNWLPGRLNPLTGSLGLAGTSLSNEMRNLSTGKPVIREIVEVRTPPFHVDDRRAELVGEIIGHESARYGVGRPAPPKL